MNIAIMNIGKPSLHSRFIFIVVYIFKSEYSLHSNYLYISALWFSFTIDSFERLLEIINNVINKFCTN